MIKKEDLYKIGQFAKPHGVKGEISLLTDYDISGITDDAYIICDMDGILVPFFIDSHRQKSYTTALIKFENIDSGEKVKLLTGKAAYLPLEMQPPPDEDDDNMNWNYITGYTVIDENLGTIGRVNDVDDSTINVLLKIDYEGGETLIPVALIAVINRESKTINVSLPEGFSEI